MYLDFIKIKIKKVGLIFKNEGICRNKCTKRICDAKEMIDDKNLIEKVKLN